MTTAIRPDGLTLAGLGLDKDMLLRVARILLADIYWDDEREREYEGSERELMKRPETPQIQDEIDALIRMAGICGRIEQAWGESFYSVVGRMIAPVAVGTRTELVSQVREQIQENLVDYAIMACIGHGVGPDDMQGFPPELDASPISIENPMLLQLAMLE